MNFLIDFSADLIRGVLIIVPIVFFILFIWEVGRAVRGLHEIRIHKKNQVKRYDKLKTYKLNSITDISEVPGDYVVLDFETTGLDPVFDDIIEIGIVKVIDNKPKSFYKRLLRPRAPLSKEITELTGIAFSMVKKKPYIEKVINEILNFIGDLPIVCHNADFDIKFLHANSPEPINNKSIDTLHFAHLYVRGMHSYKLSTLAKALHIENPNYHRSLNDCFVTQKLLVELQERAAEEDGNATKKEES